MDTFDFAKWKPCTPAEFVEQLSEAAFTVDEPTTFAVSIDTLDDRRIRMVFAAHVKPQPSECESRDEPYLALLIPGADEGGTLHEGGKTLCFVRTDAELAIP